MLDTDPWYKGYNLHPGVVAGMTKSKLADFSMKQPIRKDPTRVVQRLLRQEATTPHFTMLADQHSSEVIVWPAGESSVEQVDGVIWRGQGLALFFPGGCGALAFHDPNRNLSGLLHTSWITVGKLIVSNFLSMWQAAGGDPQTTRIRFLPAICGRCLTFDLHYWESRVQPAVRKADLQPEAFLREAGDKVGFDLMSAVGTILRRSGYDPEDRFYCTCHARDHFNHHIFNCYRCHGSKRNAAFLASG